jgi:hypothetical protein
MNCTGCPNKDFCTDGAFRESLPLECDTSLPGYYAYTFGIVGLKLIGLGKQVANWRYRHKGLRKFPLGPFNTSIYIILLIIQNILIGENLVNFRTGTSFILYSIMFLFFAWIYSYGLIYLVNLGRKIFGKKHQEELSKSADRLAKFDIFGRGMLFFQMFSLFASTLVLVVLSPILVDAELVLSRLGFGFKGAFVWFCMFGYLHQYSRCVAVIASTQKAAASITAQGSRKSELLQVIKRMRRAQIAQFIAATPSALLFTLLATGAIGASVWAALGSQAFEAVGAIYYEFVVRRRANTGPVIETSSNLNNQIQATEGPDTAKSS